MTTTRIASVRIVSVVLVVRIAVIVVISVFVAVAVILELAFNFIAILKVILIKLTLLKFPF